MIDEKSVELLQKIAEHLEAISISVLWIHLLLIPIAVFTVINNIFRNKK